MDIASRGLRDYEDEGYDFGTVRTKLGSSRLASRFERHESQHFVLTTRLHT